MVASLQIVLAAVYAVLTINNIAELKLGDRTQRRKIADKVALIVQFLLFAAMTLLHLLAQAK